MDRVNISFAALRMNQDLHFSAAVYGLGGGLFFLSYALFEVPSNLLLVRFGARRWIARIMLTWGLLAVGMMFVRTPVQFYVMRFLLGLAEAGFFPGVIFYLTLWFPAQFRGRAISRFYVAWPLSSVVMGALAGTLLDLQGRLGLAGWQWLFLIEGLPAIAMSGVILMLLPDRPADAAWLSDGERGWIEHRLAADAALLGPEDHGFLRALAHPRVLQLGAVNFLLLGGFYAFTLSAPAVLDGATHLGVTKVGYLIAFSGLLGAAAMVFNGWHSDYVKERYFHLAAPFVLMAAAFAVLSLSPPPLVAMAAYLATIIGNAAVGAVFWLVPGDLLHPRSTAVSVAAINAIGQSGSFVAPYAWGLSKDHTGGFHAGLTALPLAFLVAAAMVLILRRQTRGLPRH
jgi:ACS family tartrate transporter-like MFS transporter